jgi:hypothetical protein
VGGGIYAKRREIPIELETVVHHVGTSVSNWGPSSQEKLWEPWAYSQNLFSFQSY